MVIILSATLTCSADQFSLLVTMTTPTNQPANPSTDAPALTPDQLSQVLGAVTGDCSQDEMQTLKRELSPEGDDRLVKRMRLEKDPVATSALQQTPLAVEKAKTSPVEGIIFIIARQEFIN